VGLLNLGMDLAGELSEDLLLRYAFDATCMRFPPVEKMERQRQFEVRWPA
jgi:hypothetical protein